jgi:thymidylate synthase (FAD)
MSKVEYSDELGLELIKSNASDLDVARAAWVSTLAGDAREKDSGRVPGLINFLYRNKHMSPFEHGSFTFFVDCPIFVAREFMRHRTFSYNEVSGRYSLMKGKMYVPAVYRPIVQKGKVGEYTFEQGNRQQVQTMIDAHHIAYETCWRQYERQVEAGIAKEVARNVLPLGLYTQFYATTNPRNLMAFLDLRLPGDALAEIRAVARMMEVHLEEKMPYTYEAWRKAQNE